MEKSIWNLTFNFTSSYPTNPSSLQLVLRLGTFFGSHGLHTTPQCWKGSKKRPSFSLGMLAPNQLAIINYSYIIYWWDWLEKNPSNFQANIFVGVCFSTATGSVFECMLPAIICGYPRRTSISFCLNSSVQLPPSGQGASSAGALQSIWWSSGPQENSRQIGPRLGTPGDSGGNRTKDF